MTSPQTSKNYRNALYCLRSQEDSDCPFSYLFILELLVRLQEEHSAPLSQHSAISVVGGVGWASGLSGDNDGWGVCGAPCGHVRSASGVGSFLCDEVGSTLLALAMLVSPDLCAFAF